MLDFNRNIYKELDNWKNSHHRKPLLVRGARQVGKSYAVRTWAAKAFGSNNYLEINFEEEPKFCALFEKDLNIERIVDELNVLTGFNLRGAGKLLFLDEIQSCPKAITALRYFYEKFPSLHVVAAGSILEFILEEVAFPVGRVQSLFLFPLSFNEFLQASGKNSLADYIATHDLKTPLSEAIHTEILFFLKAYYRIGGMPAVVSHYLESRDIKDAAREQGRIIQGFKDDFAKYSKHTDWHALKTVFDKLGEVVGLSRVKYVRIDRDLSTQKLKKALSLLECAGLVHRITSTNAKKIPLQSLAKDSFFKLVFLDIGLLQHLVGFDWGRLSSDADLTTMHDGKFAEQFIGQELLASRSDEQLYHLHYWDRDIPGASAEVDFIIEFEGKPTPIEVKSGTRGTLKSLTQYQKEFSPDNSFILSQRNIEELGDTKLLPLYFVGRLS